MGRASRGTGLLAAAAIMVGGAAPALAQQIVSGTLASGDATLDTGEFYDPFDITGDAGDTLTVTLLSDDFDAYLFVRGPQDSVFSNDDAGGSSTDATLTFTLPVDGAYRIFATSYESGETGAYRLVSSVAIAGAAAQAQGGDVLSAGSRAEGTLAPGDETLEGGEFVDSYTLAGEPGSSVSVTMISPTIDTYLHVSGDGGYEAFNDDAPGGGGNSQVEAQFPASGRLMLLATSFAAGEEGAYTITVLPAD